MSKIDWSKTPDAQFFVNGSFYKYDQGKWFWSSSDGTWIETPYESPENFSWWGYRVEAPVPWNGEGHPPLGAICEFTQSSSPFAECEVVFSSRWVTVVRGKGFDDDAVDIAVAYNDKSARFRPIRTPEQIATEERNSAQKEIKQIILSMFNIDASTASGIAGVIADSNYRKQVTK